MGLSNVMLLEPAATFSQNLCVSSLYPFSHVTQIMKTCHVLNKICLQERKKKPQESLAREYVAGVTKNWTIKNLEVFFIGEVPYKHNTYEHSEMMLKVVITDHGIFQTPYYSVSQLRNQDTCFAKIDGFPQRVAFPLVLDSSIA